MAEASSGPFYAPSSGFEVVDLLDSLRPATVRLLPSRSYVDDDDDGDGTTVVVLDRLLAGVRTEDRRATWHHSIAQILAALVDLRSLTVRGVALPADVSFAHLRQLEAAYGRGHEFLPEGAVREYRVGDLLTGVEPRYGAAEPATSPPREGRVGRGADGAQVGGAVGSAAGVAAATFYLLGRGGAWPVETFLAGGAAGGIVGALTGLGVMLRRR